MCARVASAVMMLLALCAVPAAGQEVRLVDGDTIVRNGVKYRLDGIDAPEVKQKCLLADGAPWLCGEAALNALAEFIDTGNLSCDDVGEDRKYHRRVGRCFVNGISVEHWLVREGWAIEFKQHSDGRYAAEEQEAKQHKRGIWASCFTDPRDFRYANKNTAELKGECPKDRAAEAIARDQLFWSGHYIKAKLFEVGRQLATGFKGIYHTEGCASFGKMASIDQGGRLLYFASATEAEEQGFRKAKNCQ
jgi:endonuclease YncB( thermonuclease family)